MASFFAKSFLKIKIAKVEKYQSKSQGAKFKNHLTMSEVKPLKLSATLQKKKK